MKTCEVTIRRGFRVQAQVVKENARTVWVRLIHPKIDLALLIHSVAAVEKLLKFHKVKHRVIMN